MGVSHLAIASADPRIDLVAVCDSQPLFLTGVRTQLDLATYKNVDKMIDDQQLDAIFVATPTASHVELARTALQRGVSVFVEKPLTLSAAESAELARLADSNGAVGQVGYHNRFIGTFREAARLVESGVIGSVQQVDGKAFGPVVVKPPEGGLTWRSKKSEGGGCLHDYACHVIDLMNFVAGRPSGVTGASLSSMYSTDVEDVVRCFFSYGNGATGALEANWSDESYRKMTTTIQVQGEWGKIFADRQECRLYLKPGRGSDEFEDGWTIRYITELQEPVDFYLRGEEYSAQVAAFASAVQGRPDPAACTFDDGAATDHLVEEIVRVAEGGTAAVMPTDSDLTQLSPADAIESVRTGIRSLMRFAATVVRDLLARVKEMFGG